ncbi:Tudor micrococcal nuclease [Operophtera brumata]|uniref:Staphylococcal nuclease domain-containing protein 1 n=1 Tax=Operophtera brumata TaxID=104452 RepID=A0A0L7LQD1_OPEBR|nr:Tudor micrococcal nuclease [Operophtera brumata]
MSAPPAAPAYKIGIVKQVLSGDTIVIRKQPQGGPPPEKIIALSGITAPKLARQRTPNKKLLVGKEVIFTSEKPLNSATREYGYVWSGKDPTKDENVTEALLAEGLAKVRDGGRNIPQLKRLVDIEEAAKNAGKGIWSADAHEHVRDIKWTVDNPKQYVNKFNGSPIKSVVEYVRDGSTKDIEVVLESVNNNNFVGTILHPQGNIAEVLLRQGFAKCVDWSLAVMKSGAASLRTSERAAKDAKLRIWTNYVSNAPTIAAKDKDFVATVLEVVNGDALMVKLNNNTQKKIFLASIRSPRPNEEGKQSPRPKGFKPLYDIPWMFEARESIRKKLIGKKVNVTVDYIQPAKDNFPEKICCTVVAGGQNIAEGLVAKGFATVVRYRNDNDQRSSHYDKLLEAELKAQKAGIGVHAKKDIPTHRIQDTSGDSAKSKKFFPFLKRAQKTEATVEFVASGSRMRLYIPKVKFMSLHVVDNENLSVSLVEHGLASMHHTAETSEYARVIKTAEENAMRRRIGVWRDYVVITEITNEGSFFAQSCELGAKLENLMERLHQEFKANEPLPGSFTPRRGNICASRFTIDDQWYRAKVEKIVDQTMAQILYIDYGNREPYAHEYTLCCVKFPADPDDRAEAISVFSADTLNKKLALNVEMRGAPPANLIKEGLVLLEWVREARLSPLVAEYRAAQEHAKAARLNMWRHGDITDDDAVEFGARR